MADSSSNKNVFEATKPTRTIFSTGWGKKTGIKANKTEFETTASRNVEDFVAADIQNLISSAKSKTNRSASTNTNTTNAPISDASLIDKNRKNLNFFGIDTPKTDSKIRKAVKKSQISSTKTDAEKVNVTQIDKSNLDDENIKKKLEALDNKYQSLLKDGIRNLLAIQKIPSLKDPKKANDITNAIYEKFTSNIVNPQNKRSRPGLRQHRMTGILRNILSEKNPEGTKVSTADTAISIKEFNDLSFGKLAKDILNKTKKARRNLSEEKNNLKDSITLAVARAKQENKTTASSKAADHKEKYLDLVGARVIAEFTKQNKTRIKNQILQLSKTKNRYLPRIGLYKATKSPEFAAFIESKLKSLISKHTLTKEEKKFLIETHLPIIKDQIIKAVNGSKEESGVASDPRTFDDYLIDSNKVIQERLQNAGQDLNIVDSTLAYKIAKRLPSVRVSEDLEFSIDANEILKKAVTENGNGDDKTYSVKTDKDSYHEADDNGDKNKKAVKLFSKALFATAKSLATQIKKESKAHLKTSKEYSEQEKKIKITKKEQNIIKKPDQLHYIDLAAIKGILGAKWTAIETQIATFNNKQKGGVTSNIKPETEKDSQVQTQLINEELQKVVDNNYKLALTGQNLQDSENVSKIKKRNDIPSHVDEAAQKSIINNFEKLVKVSEKISLKNEDDELIHSSSTNAKPENTVSDSKFQAALAEFNKTIADELSIVNNHNKKVAPEIEKSFNERQEQRLHDLCVAKTIINLNKDPFLNMDDAVSFIANTDNIHTPIDISLLNLKEDASDSDISSAKTAIEKNVKKTVGELTAGLGKEDFKGKATELLKELPIFKNNKGPDNNNLLTDGNIAELLSGEVPLEVNDLMGIKSPIKKDAFDSQKDLIEKASNAIKDTPVGSKSKSGSNKSKQNDVKKRSQSRTYTQDHAQEKLVFTAPTQKKSQGLISPSDAPATAETAPIAKAKFNINENGLVTINNGAQNNIFKECEHKGTRAIPKEGFTEIDGESKFTHIFDASITGSSKWLEINSENKDRVDRIVNNKDLKVILYDTEDKKIIQCDSKDKFQSKSPSTSPAQAQTRKLQIANTNNMGRGGDGGT